MIYIFGIVFSIFFVIFILLLVRNNKLQENYSILWIFFSICIVIVSVFPQIITKLADLFDVVYQPSIIYFFMFIILAIYIIHLSIVSTKQNKRIIKLTQELAILKNKCEKNENKQKENKEKVNIEK